MNRENFKPLRMDQIPEVEGDEPLNFPKDRDEPENQEPSDADAHGAWERFTPRY